MFVPSDRIELSPPALQTGARHHESFEGASPGMVPGLHRHLFGCQRVGGATSVRGSPGNRTRFYRLRVDCFAIKA